ncbi:MAG: PEP-CTERM sorting domain-containing protein [Opitutaceae bacterium]|jgi:hypothetical protein|nr:PEP-CTERM sorting domain-containing protein [Opitutaceae bacterium]
MKTFIHQYILAAALATVIGTFSPSARAALEIKKSDITEIDGVSKYAYSLSYADMTKMVEDAGKDPENGNATLLPGSGGKFFDDIFEASDNIRLMVEASGVAGSRKWNSGFVYANGGTAQSSFTYKFDFTSAGYEIASFTVKENLYAANQTRSVTTQYSTDGTTWIDADSSDFTNVLRTTTSITSGTFSIGTSSPISLASGVSALYYRVVFTSLNGTTALSNQQSWNRLNGTTGSSNLSFFEVNFDLTPAPVPEPATIAMLAGSGVLVFVLFRRRFRN